MRRRILGGLAAIAAVAGLTLAFGPQPAGAQLRPPAPTLTDLALQASQALGVPCNAYYSTGTFECSGYRTASTSI